MNGEHQAFLNAILARPHDDGPRLVFADYLDDSDDATDQARADFIRTQLALARISEDHPRRRELLNHQNDLLLRHHTAWTRHLRGLAAGFEFRRGLLDSVSVDVATFLARGEELFQKVAVRRLRVLDAGRHIASLSSCPTLAAVRELDLCGNELGNGGVNVLLRSPHLTKIESLDLSFNGICDSGLQRLARCANLPKLRSLALNDNGQIGDDGVRHLAESTELTALRQLDLSGNDIGVAGVVALTESEYLTQLHTLRLHANHIGDAGVTALADSELLTRMLAKDPRLDLRRNSIGPIGVRELAASRRLVSVVSLDLGSNTIGDGGLVALGFADILVKMTRLVVRHNRIGDDGSAVFARSPVMSRLRWLDVSGNIIGERGIDALWRWRKDARTQIDYSENLVTSGANAYTPSVDPPSLSDEAAARRFFRHTFGA